MSAEAADWNPTSSPAAELTFRQAVESEAHDWLRQAERNCCAFAFAQEGRTSAAT
jgi:hypothetical protein